MYYLHGTQVVNRGDAINHRNDVYICMYTFRKVKPKRYTINIPSGTNRRRSRFSLSHQRPYCDKMFYPLVNPVYISRSAHRDSTRDLSFELDIYTIEYIYIYIYLYENLTLSLYLCLASSSNIKYNIYLYNFSYTLALSHIISCLLSFFILSRPFDSRAYFLFLSCIRLHYVVLLRYLYAHAGKYNEE